MAIQISLFYAGILGMLMVALSFNVMQNWVRVTGAGQETDQQMRRAEKVLASFVEYVPLALLLLLFVELKGAPQAMLHVLGAMLVVARVLHAFGSNQIPMAGLLRFAGAQLTFIMVTICSLACIYSYAIGPM